MMREFDSLSYLLESVLTGLEMGTRTREYLAVLLWPDIVGEAIARITAVQSVRAGVLYVDVENSAWAQELQFCKPDLIQKINRYLAAESVQDIHFRVRAREGGVRLRLAHRPASRRRRRGQPAAIQLTLEECQEIEATSDGVHDAELRSALASTMASYRRMERWLEQDGWTRCGACKAMHRPRRPCPFCGHQKEMRPRKGARPADRG